MSRLIESTLTGKISNMLIEEDSRYYILRKLQNCFDELDSIDYGDNEGTDRYGHIEPGLEDQKRIDEKIRKLVQDNNITRAEWDSVFTDPYKSGFDLSYEDYAYNPKHASEEDKDKLRESDCHGRKGLLSEAWNGTIKSGAKLRDLINEFDEGASAEDCQKVLDALKDCCKEAMTLTDDEYYQNGFQSVIDDIEMIYDDEDLDYSNVNYELDGFYDYCDGANLWVSLQESANNTHKWDKVADFMMNYDIYGARDNYEGSDEEIKEKLVADIENDPGAAKDYIQEIINNPEENTEEQLTSAKDILKFFEDVEIPNAEDLEADDKATKEKRIKELEDKIAQINMEIGDPSLDVADVRDLSQDRDFLQAELDDLRGLVECSKSLNEDPEGRVKVSIGSQDRYYEPGDPKIEIAQKIKEKLGPLADKVDLLELFDDHIKVAFENKGSGISYISAHFDEDGNIKGIYTHGTEINKDFLDIANALYNINGSINECDKKLKEDDNLDKGNESIDELKLHLYDLKKIIDDEGSVDEKLLKNKIDTMIDLLDGYKDDMNQTLNEKPIDEAHSLDRGSYTDYVFDQEDADYFQKLVGPGIKVSLEDRGEEKNSYLTFTLDSKWISGFTSTTKELDEEIKKYFEKYPELEVKQNNTGTTLWLGKKYKKESDEINESVTVVTSDGSSVDTSNSASVQSDEGTVTVTTSDATVVINNSPELPVEDTESEETVIDTSVEEPTDVETTENSEEVIEESDDDYGINANVEAKSLSVLKNQGPVYMLQIEKADGNTSYWVVDNFNQETYEGDSAEEFNNKDDADVEYFKRVGVDNKSEE